MINNETFLVTIFLRIIRFSLASPNIVFTFHDITEFERINRIKAQRLEAIEEMKPNYQNQSQMLIIYYRFYSTFILKNKPTLRWGSIQLKRISSIYFQEFHSNFPDKIRQQYRFLHGQSISEYALEKRTICHIDDYPNNPKVSGKTKVAINAYLCIPIMVQRKSKLA